VSDVQDFLEKLGLEFVKASGDELNFYCPLCGDEKPDHFYVNSLKGVWNCHKCGDNGNLRHLVTKLADAGILEEEECREAEARLDELHDELRKKAVRLIYKSKAKPLSNKVLNRWYRELADRAGIPRITSHGSRHGVGSSYAALGAGEALIAELLGHADQRSSSTYTHVRVETTQAIVEARWAKLNGGEK
jgi:integrase